MTIKFKIEQFNEVLEVVNKQESLFFKERPDCLEEMEKHWSDCKDKYKFIIYFAFKNTDGKYVDYKWATQRFKNNEEVTDLQQIANEYLRLKYGVYKVDFEEGYCIDEVVILYGDIEV